MGFFASTRGQSRSFTAVAWHAPQIAGITEDYVRPIEGWAFKQNVRTGSGKAKGRKGQHREKREAGHKNSLRASMPRCSQKKRVVVTR
jgi:hypothetical protein